MIQQPLPFCFWVCFLREEGVGRLLQFFSLLTVGLLVCIDQLIKIIIKLWLEPLQNVPVIPNVLHLIYVENTGAAFGVLKGSAVVMGVLSSVIFYCWHLSNRQQKAEHGLFPK